MTTFQIYRTDARSYAPDSRGSLYAFAPIEGYVSTNGLGLIVGSADDSSEPFATILAPDGTSIAEAEGGDPCLFVPGERSGIPADEAYEFACQGVYGLSLAQGDN